MRKLSPFILTVISLFLSVGVIRSAVIPINISGKLKMIQRDVKIAIDETTGNVFAVWNQSDPEKNNSGKIYGVELIRQPNGSYIVKSEPFVIFPEGQRPSVVYLTETDQYLISCDTGPRNPWSQESFYVATKILVRTYKPSNTNSLSASVFSLGVSTPVVDDGQRSLYPYLRHIGGDEAGNDKVLLICPRVIINSTSQVPEEGSRLGIENQSYLDTQSLLIEIFPDALFYSSPWIIITEFRQVFDVLFGQDGSTAMAAFLQVSPGGPAITTSAGLMIFNFILCQHIKTTLFGTITGWFLQGMISIAYLSSALSNADDLFESAAALNCAAVYNTIDSRQPEVTQFKNDGKIKKIWGPLWTSPKHGVDFWRMVNIKKTATYRVNPAVNKSQTYVIFHNEKGHVLWRNLLANGKPSGKAVKVFRTKKNKFGGLDASGFQDEALMAYVEYTNKKKTKSTIKFAYFKIK